MGGHEASGVVWKGEAVKGFDKEVRSIGNSKSERVGGKGVWDNQVIKQRTIEASQRIEAQEAKVNAY